jgi:tetratricopeptide (TPR) repeat protein
MVAFLVAAAMLGAQPCSEAATSALRDASARAQASDLPGAVDRLRGAVGEPCEATDVAVVYLSGLSAALDAYNQGGSEESLAPVREAIAALDKASGQRPGAAEIARLVLVAAAAAAQSEREEMAAFLTHATAMESLQFAAKQPGAPVLSAHEVAGELWLQVHQFDDARAAFERAAVLVGMTPRIAGGLARAAAR